MIIYSITNLIFLLLGILIGYWLNKKKIENFLSDSSQKIKSILIKPLGRVIDSKEENSLNKIEDDVDYHHNDYFDEPG